MSTRLPAGIALLAIAAGIACGARADGPPRMEEDRTACSRCGMLVSERMFAAAYRPRALKGRAAAGEARVFDDIGCLLAAAHAERDPSALEFWFHDAETREWIDGRRAIFVRSPSFNTPMAGGVLAYVDDAAARDAAIEHGGRVIPSIEQLLKEPFSAGGTS